MSIHLALLIVAVVALIGNRIVALLIGLIFRVPTSWLLPTVVVLDLIQIPFFYWLYENSATIVNRLPVKMRGWFKKDWNISRLGRWTSSLGGVGVFVVAAMPTFGGGMWSAVFLAYGLRLRKTLSYTLISMGSLLSYLGLFYILDTVVRTVRYFCSQ